MQASKSIKLSITNNDAHHLCTKQQLIANIKHKIVEKLNEMENEEYLSLNDELGKVEKFNDEEIRLMFTIRQEQSCECDSDIVSKCGRHKHSCDSILAELSTIKVDRDRQNSNEFNEKILITFENIAGKELTDIETMISSIEKQFTNHQPHVQCWQQKIKQQTNNMRKTAEDQPVEDEKIFVLKPSQRKLYLNKMSFKLQQKLKFKFNTSDTTVMRQENLSFYGNKNKKKKLTLVKNFYSQSFNLW